MIITVAQWAEEENISRVAAYKRIQDHAIPFVSKGKIDRDIANRIWKESANPAKQRGGEAGGSNGQEPRETFVEEQPPLFSGIPESPRTPTSAIGKVQLKRELLRIRREELLIAELEGRLVPRDDVREFESQQVAAAKELLLTAGAELRDELAATPSPTRCQELVDKRIHEALSKLSQWRPKKEPTQ